MFQLAVSIVSGVLLARYLGPEGKGQTFLAFQFASFASLILSMGLGPAYLYQIKRGGVTPQLALAHASSVIVVSGLMGAMLYSFARPLLRAVTNNALSDEMLLLVVLLSLVYLAANFLGFLLMSEPDGVATSSIITMTSGGIYVLAILLFIVILKWNVYGALLAMATPIVVRLVIIGSVFVPRLSKVPPASLLGATKPLLTYGFGAFSASMMMNSVLRLDTFLVNGLAGPSQLGIYSIAVSLAEISLLIPSAIGVAAFPHLSGQERTERVLTAARVSRLGVALGVGSAIGLAVGAYPVIVLAFGDAFAGAFPSVLALLPGLVAMNAIYGYSNFFSSDGRPFVNTLIFGVTALVNVAANWVLVPRYGAVGAGAASSICYITAACLFLYVLQRDLELRLREWFVPDGADLTASLRACNAILRRAKP